MKRIASLSVLVAVLAMSGQAMSDFCEKCKGQAYTKDVGSCSDCGGFTSSGQFALCMGCSDRLRQCEHCRAKLGEDPSTAGATEELGVQAQVWTEGEAFDEKQPMEPWIREELGKQGARGASLAMDWFPVGPRWTTVHDSRHFGQVEIRLEEASTAETLVVRIGGTAEAKLDLPRKSGTTLVHKHTVSTSVASTTWFFALKVVPPSEEARSIFEVQGESNGKTLEVAGVTWVDVMLAGNATTGYAWELSKITGGALEASGKIEYFGSVSPERAGEGGTFRARFRVAAVGASTIEMVYRRSWEKEEAPAETFTVTIQVTALAK